jgi:hypothetical protein
LLFDGSPLYLLLLSHPPQDTLFDDLILVMQSSPMQFVRDHGWSAIEISEGSVEARAELSS